MAVDRIERPAPIGHGDALVMPRVAENRFQKVFVVGSVDAVDEVIRGHDRPRIRFFHHDLERFQVEFVQGAVVDDRIADVAIALLGIAGVMLHAGSDATVLDAFDERRAHFARKKRIFGKILEVATTKRVSFDVHPRGQEERGVFARDFEGHRFADLALEILIPRTSQRGGRGIASRRGGIVWIRGVLSDLADAERAVVHLDAWEVQATNPMGVPKAIPVDEMALLPQGQFLFVFPFHGEMIRRFAEKINLA